jgi:hypothetical protein
MTLTSQELDKIAGLNYRPAGLPREKQPWRASIWRR